MDEFIDIPISNLNSVDNANLGKTSTLVQQAEEERFLAGLQARATNEGFMSDEAIEAEIQAARNKIDDTMKEHLDVMDEFIETVKSSDEIVPEFERLKLREAEIQR